MCRIRAFRRGAALCLVWALAWPHALAASINSSGDATVLPPPGDPLPSYLFAGLTGFGEFVINGSTPAAFPVIYLGSNNPMGAATAASRGNVTVTGGAQIFLSNIQGIGPGKGSLTIQ